MFRHLFRFLASLKLALLLLAVLIVATALGTIWESKLNADVAKKYVYDAWWFNLWLVMLCVNLFSVAAIRYPWKPHQTGFVITHAGIIILLIGGLIDRTWGIEGFVALYRGDEPADMMELHSQKLTVHTPDALAPAVTQVKLKSLVTPKDFRFKVNTPSPEIKVEVADIYPPAAQLVLQGAVMGRHEMWVFLHDNSNLGPASLSFQPGMPPEPKKAEPKVMKKMPRMERHFVFAKHEEKFGRALIGEPTKAEAKLEMDEAGEKPLLKLKLFGKEYSVAVKENLKKHYPLDGLPEWQLLIGDYFPNFRMMEDKKPGNLNDNPENPAVLFELTGPLVDAPETPDEEDDPHGGAHGGKKAGGGGGGNALALYLGEDGKLRYFLKGRKTGESSGEVELGKAVSVGWAPGAEFIVQRVFPNGISEALARETEAIKGLSPKTLETRNPGLLCRVSAGNESKLVWVPQSTARSPQRRRVDVGGKVVELALPNGSQNLPFTVSLQKFSAPHDEGQPMSFSEFASVLSFDGELDRVRLKADAPSFKELGEERAAAGRVFECAITDLSEEHMTIEFPDKSDFTLPRSEVAEFERRTHKIHMNNPTTYPATWYGPWLGTGYKFSQANHDMPRNPDYSGVQVLRDPGWMPKWVGSLMIVFGIFTMFYLKPYFKGRREVLAKRQGSGVSGQGSEEAGVSGQGSVDSRQLAVGSRQ